MKEYYIKVVILGLILGVIFQVFNWETSIVNVTAASSILALAIWTHEFHWDSIKTHINNWAKL